MNRLFVSFATFVLFGASNALAAPNIVFSEGDSNNDLNVKLDADGERVATFAYKKDIWVVFSGDENPRITIPTDIRKRTQLTVQELLESPQGVGVRFAFAKQPNVSYEFDKVRGGSPEADVNITPHPDGIEVSGVADARFVNVHSPSLQQSYSVLPMSALQASTSRKFGNIVQRYAPAGRVFYGEDGAPLRTLFKDDRYYIADDAQGLLALATMADARKSAEETLSKAEVAESVDAVETPKTKAQQTEVPVANVATVKPAPKKPTYTLTTAEAKLAKELGVADTRLLSEKSKILLLSADELLAQRTQNKSVTPVEKAPARNIVETTKTVKIPAASNQERLAVTEFQKIQPAAGAEQLTMSEELDDQPLVTKILVAQPKPEAVQVQAPKISAEEKEESLNNALSVVEGALAGLKSLYTPKSLSETKVEAVDEPSQSTPEVEPNYNEFFGDNVAADNKHYAADDSEIDETMFASENGEIDVAGAWAQEADDVSELVITLEDGPLFVKAVDAPYSPYAKVGDLHEDSYLYKHNQIMSELGQSFSRVKRDRVRLQLAKLALAYGRPEETLSYLDYMPKMESDERIPQAEDARMLAGVANIMIGRPEDALPYLEEPTENYESDRKLWLGVAYEALERFDDATNLLANNITQTESYPEPLIKDAYFAYGRALLRLERVSALKKLMDELVSILPNRKLPPEAELQLARANLVQGNDREAEKLLAKVANSGESEVAFLAQYEFVHFLLSKGDIGMTQAIDHLERLRYLWRGGEVEERILDKLGRMYLAQGEHRKGLERLKQHNIYYPNSKTSQETTQLMSASFKELFLDETTFTTMDDLAILGIYYDFRELTPPGKKGDELIRHVAARLKLIGLFDRASRVLEDQLQYRVENENQRTVLGLRLADLYRLNGYYDEALNALVRTESPSVSDEIAKERQYKEAQILFEQKSYDQALERLAGLNMEKAQALRAEIAWQEERFKTLVTELEPLFADPTTLPTPWRVEDNVRFTQLAVAYNSLGRVRDLEGLKKRYKIELEKDEDLADIMNFLLKEGGSAELLDNRRAKGMWVNLSTAFENYHSFATYYDALREERAEEKINRKIFNRRMRQMSAPPRL